MTDYDSPVYSVRLATNVHTNLTDAQVEKLSNRLDIYQVVLSNNDKGFIEAHLNFPDHTLPLAILRASAQVCEALVEIGFKGVKIIEAEATMTS